MIESLILRMLAIIPLMKADLIERIRIIWNWLLS